MHMKKSKTLLSLLFAGMMWMPLTAGAVTTNGHATSVAPDDQTISGTVEDANGPMIGATVKVVGSSAGTVTDIDGTFKVKCKPGDMLEISYIGFATKQVKAKQRGFSTFIWDNNSFGSGSEHFGIFDRNAGMKVKAPWVLQGILDGKK